MFPKGTIHPKNVQIIVGRGIYPARRGTGMRGTTHLVSRRQWHDDDGR